VRIKEMVKQAPFVYQRVKQALVDMIAEGNLEPGDKLPSERQLARQLGCNYHTVRKGLALLEEERLVECRVGSGTFVTGSEEEEGGMAGEPAEAIVSRRKVSVKTKAFVGVICPATANEFSGEFLSHLHQQAEERGFGVKIQTVSDFGVSGRQSAREFIEHGCVALLLPFITASMPPQELWQLIQPLRVPVVLGQPVPGLEKYCYERQEIYGRPSFAAVELACRYFKELGYGQIGFFGGNCREEPDLQRRLTAYSCFAARENLATHIGMVGPGGEEVDALVRRWSTMAGNLAVVCWGDEYALRLMTSLHKLDLRIPEDVAVMGFRNIPLAGMSDPPLSTIQFDHEYVAGAMLDHAEAQSKGESAQAEGYARQILIIRESCGGKLRAGEKLSEIIERVQTIHDRLEKS
jgi:DNA-binding LacI/PurR family transcriptional regulator